MLSGAKILIVNFGTTVCWELTLLFVKSPKKKDINVSYIIKITHEYKVHGAREISTGMDLVFMSTFANQSMSIGCVGKLGHLFLLRFGVLWMFFSTMIPHMNDFSTTSKGFYIMWYIPKILMGNTWLAL